MDHRYFKSYTKFLVQTLLNTPRWDESIEYKNVALFKWLAKVNRLVVIWSGGWWSLANRGLDQARPNAALPHSPLPLVDRLDLSTFCFRLPLPFVFLFSPCCSPFNLCLLHCATFRVNHIANSKTRLKFPDLLYQPASSPRTLMYVRNPFSHP